MTGAAGSGVLFVLLCKLEGTIKQRVAAFKRTNLSVDVLPPMTASGVFSIFHFCLSVKIHTQLESSANIDFTDCRIRLYNKQKSQVNQIMLKEKYFTEYQFIFTLTTSVTSQTEFPSSVSTQRTN